MTYRCSECGQNFEGQPALRRRFDDAVVDLMTEEQERSIRDVLASFGLGMQSPDGIYQICAECKAEIDSPEVR